MPYTLRLATPETRTLVVDALRSAADQRTRVARGAARKVAAAKAAGSDVRSQAVKVTALLAEADELTELATDLEAAEEVPVMASVDSSRTVDEFTAAAEAEQRADEDVEAATRERIATLRTALTEDTPREAVDSAPETEDDGTSQQAQRLATLAGLTPTVLEEDPETGALPEDEPADDDVAEDLNL